MKQHARLFFQTNILVFLLGLLLVLTSCGGTGTDGTTVPGTTPGDSYEIIFSVNGNEYKQTVAAGEIPVFTGSTDRANDTEHHYVFAGWDKEPVAATENTTYTATYHTYGLTTYTVRWVMEDRTDSTTVYEGEVPVPPTPTLTVDNVTQVLTFTGWDREITAVEAGATGSALIYSAKYTKAARQYTVTYRVDGETVATVKADYGALPAEVYPKSTPTKTGYNYCSWSDGYSAITGDTTCDATFTVLDPEQLSYSLGVSPAGFVAGENDNRGDVMNEASALLYMTLEIRNTPTGNTASAVYLDRVLAHLRNLITAGDNAPYFDLEPYWCYVPLTAAITLCHETPVIWDSLTAAEQEKYDFVMKCFAYVLALGTSDQNNYKTGPGMIGNFGKAWNPNYRLANVLPMVFVRFYFGSAAAVDAILAAFDFETTVAKFQEYGFDRAYAQWTKDPPVAADGTVLPGPATFMETGGPAYLLARTDGNADRLGYTAGDAAGTGAGVRVQYRYATYTLDQYDKIIATLLNHNYSGGKVVSSYGTYTDGASKSYILDGTSSPVEGLYGMMKEFASSDGGNGTGGSDIRSSCSYTSHDFIMVVSMLAALDSLDAYQLDSEANLSLFTLAWAGNTDFIYKYQHGYMSFSLGKAYESHESASSGYYIWKTWWLDEFGHYTKDTLPEIVEEFNPVILDQDYTGESVTADKSTVRDNLGISYGANGKTGVLIKTETDADGNVFIKLTQATGALDPSINFSGNDGLAKAMGDYTKVTFSFALALADGAQAPSSTCRMRGVSTSDVVSIFSTTGAGNVTLGTSEGNVITTLTTSFQTISVTVDFEAMTMTGYLNGTEVCTMTFAIPAASAATDGLTWLDTLSTYMFNWWFRSGSDTALLIDDVSVVVEVPESEEPPVIEDEGGEETGL